MSRRTYKLSAETIKVVNGSATKVADEFGCDPAYIHQILGQTATDPFAKFEWLFASAVKAGCDVGPWLRRLEVICAKYAGMGSGCVQTETAKFVKESNDVAMAAIENKSLDRQLIEADEALRQLEIHRKTIVAKIAAGESANVREFTKEKVETRGRAA